MLRALGQEEEEGGVGSYWALPPPKNIAKPSGFEHMDRKRTKHLQKKKTSFFEFANGHFSIFSFFDFSCC